MVSVGSFDECFAEKAQHFFDRVFFLGQSGDFVMSTKSWVGMFEAFVICANDFVKIQFWHETGGCFLELISTG